MQTQQPKREKNLELGQCSGDSEVVVLTVTEAARMLRVNRKSIYRAVSRGEIRGVRRFGRAIRISKSALLDWMQRGTGEGA